MLRELERFIARVQDGRAASNATLPQVNPDLVGEIKLILAPVDGDANGRRITAVPVSAANGAWWANAALVARLGLTDDQKTRIERAFESNRQNLTASKDLLEKEETQLSKLLGAETLDRTATIAQIYKVVQARGEMERINSLMTLEMRGVLTRAQWTQLESQPGTNRVLYYTTGQPGTSAPGTPQPGTRGAGGRGASPVKQ
jgi:Spy/CpxP family protein refolding chaperone